MEMTNDGCDSLDVYFKLNLPDGYGIIYKASSTSGKVYIGQTINPLNKRICGHIRLSKTGAKTKFCKAIRKYGANLKWEILYLAPKSELNASEVREIAKHNSYKYGYNSDLGGNKRDEYYNKRILSKKMQRSKRKNSKLNEDIIQKVRSLHDSGKYTYDEIARLIGNIVTPVTIGKIVRNEIWKNINYKMTKWAQKGERNNGAKITLEIAKKIRNEFTSGYSSKELSDKYNISCVTIRRIIRNVVWIERDGV